MSTQFDVRAQLDLPPTLTPVVDGEWLPLNGLTSLPVLDPATGLVVLEVADATDETVDHAVASAQRAFTSTWGKTDPVVRGRILLAIAQALRVASEDLSRAESLDSGKPLSQARADVETAARYFEFYAGSCDKIYGDMLPQASGFAYTRREAHGVVGIITPWNSPIAQMCRSVAPALAAGNTVVVKPSELTPITSVAAARLFVDAGLPRGACNVVPGRGAGAGAALCAHPGVRYISFTGSVETGQTVGAACGVRIVGCSLELGGKSATIILPDANLDAASRAGVAAVIRNAGQSCFATTRLVVHRSVHEELIARMIGLFDDLTIGPGLDDPALGPLISQGQREKTLRYVARAVADGARIVNDTSATLPEEGFFVLPSLLVDVRNEMELARQEVFGPVQSVIVVDSEEEALLVANDSDYGLAAGVFTASLASAHRLAAQLQAGQVQVNRYPLGGVDTPFGGYKQSGLGREKGIEALLHYTQLKTVIVYTDEDE